MEDLIIIKYGKAVPLDKMVSLRNALKKLFIHRNVLTLPHGVSIQEMNESEFAEVANERGYFKTKSQSLGDPECFPKS